MGVLRIFYKMSLYYVVLYYGHCNWLLKSNELVDPNNFSPIKNVLVTPLEMKIILHLKLLTNITHVFMFAHCMLRNHAQLNGWGPCLFNNSCYYNNCLQITFDIASTKCKEKKQWRMSNMVVFHMKNHLCEH